MATKSFLKDIDYNNLSKDGIIYIIRNHKKKLEELLLEIIENLLDKQDLFEVYYLFNQVYDEIYYDIIFKRVNLEKRVVKIIETFATPLYKKSDLEQKKILKRYF